MECGTRIRLSFLLPVTTSCFKHRCHRSNLRISGQIQFGQHRALPMLKALAQGPLPGHKVLLTPDGASTAAASFLVGSSGFSTLRAPAVNSAMIFLSALVVIVLEIGMGPLILPFAAIHHDAALRRRHSLRVLLSPEKSVATIPYNTVDLSPIKPIRFVL